MAESEWLNKDFYKVLGVSQDSQEAEITKAYRKLARQYHPDINKDPHAEEKFKEIGEAYDVLKNAETRKKYDTLRRFAAGGARFTGGAGGQGYGDIPFADMFGGMFGNDRSHHYQTQGANFDLNDIFSMFGQASRSSGNSQAGAPHDFFQRPQKKEKVTGKDREGKVKLTFKQAVKGAKVSLRLGGKEFSVRVPSGVKNEQKLRIAGKGHPGKNGGKTGDLYLTIFVEPDEHFSMRGDDIIFDLPITVGEAIGGAKIAIRDYDDKEVIFKIPAGTSSGDEIALKNRGVSETQGSLIAVVRIVVPSKSSGSLKKLARQLDEESSGFIDEFQSVRNSHNEIDN